MSGGRRRLVLASGNRHKVGELARMVAGAGMPLEVRAAGEFGVVPEVVEDADTFVGNALLKARGFAGWLAGLGVPGDTLVVADDSGLCVDVLEGGPGVWSARFAGPGAGDARNNARLVAELEARGLTASLAHYVCVLVVARVDGAPVSAGSGAAELAFEGRMDGEVRTSARGSGGFGYDPHFWIDGGARTVAELSADAKGERSHRGAATRALLAALPGILAGGAG